MRLPDQFDLGHPIYCAAPNSFAHPRGDWRYCDDDSSIYESNRACPRCGKRREHGRQFDPCLGELPNVYSACCGHGVVEPYVNIIGEFKRLTGAEALNWFRIHGKQL